jgi:uncharacterized membrane protein
MESLFSILLALHVASGSLGLLLGTYVLIAKKGDKKHKLAGKIFALSMLGSAICAIVMAKLHDNMFLLTVGVFTIYLVGTGWRYLSLKQLANGQKPLWIDYALSVFMLVFAVFFVYMGVLTLMSGNTFGLAPLFFAFVGGSMVYRDFRMWQGHITEKNFWLLQHIQRMMGGYIASVTAFLVVNAPEGLGVFPWLLPTALLVPFIVKWSRERKVKN